MCVCVQCFDTVIGRQEGHLACKKTEWWGAGMVICLKRCADLHSALSCIRTIKWLIIITIIVITDVDNWPAVAAAEMQPAVHSPAMLVLTPRLAPFAADDQLQTCT